MSSDLHINALEYACTHLCIWAYAQRQREGQGNNEEEEEEEEMEKEVEEEEENFASLNKGSWRH